MRRTSRAIPDAAPVGPLHKGSDKRSIAAQLFGPHPAAVGRLRGRYRYDVLLVFNTAAALLSAWTC